MTTIRALGILALLPGSFVVAFAAGPAAETIIQNSVQANERDWQAAANYSYTVTTRKAGSWLTERVVMLNGSPYRRRLRVNGKALSPEAQKREQARYEEAVAQRRSESKTARDERISKYEKERNRDHLLMQQLTRAFVFKLNGQKNVAGRSVYYLVATPRPGYQPPNLETRVLTGMKGELWIDTKSFQWVRVRAEVISPVSIEGFLATVQPGTFFELEKQPVADDIWLPKHFRVESQSKVLRVFSHATQEDDTFSDYQPGAANN